MSWIQNVSLADIRKGHHISVGENSMLIQIVDPDFEFPHPYHNFKEVHQFKFLDTEDKADPYRITEEQASTLVELLQHALNKRMNVIVHCHAGICRSGAVAEVGVIMGFRDSESFRSPNLLVKHLMMEKLGWGYDKDEPHTWNENFSQEDWEGDI